MTDRMPRMHPCIKIIELLHDPGGAAGYGAAQVPETTAVRPLP